MSNKNFISIRQAREHNLKGIDLDIPRGKFIVITGLSGSGKSSLAFDTIYAEGQRRYIESLSSYARQFLDQMEKPDVESITGLTPTIAIEQTIRGHRMRGHRFFTERLLQVFCKVAKIQLEPLWISTNRMDSSEISRLVVGRLPVVMGVLPFLLLWLLLLSQKWRILEFS